ncbi:hypothetical protein [Brachyspira catarrhinii]|uniref:Uncharacterized protein n=1 Tax=Brachyspira catarrhinii TaxID=2528966 RepID=A0ABY2TWR0_9SPIR|nr:hypothetical protein [Brachyspira catarrhinii]TKZ36341.1 hypothetical protein EZH24_00530 [Brachyspira catarrhinii]
MANGYTKNEIINKLENLKDISTLYKEDFINYRGNTTDTKEKYTEVVAEWLLNNIDLLYKIQKITRLSSYKVETHDGKYTPRPNPSEEIIAMDIFNQGSLNILGKVLDYQTPLKNVRDDDAGKIDIVSYNRDIKTVYLLELKKEDNEETMLRCVLEIFTYLRILDTDKFLFDFGLPKDTKIKASPLVFFNGSQHKEMIGGNNKFLKQLMDKLDIEPFYITKNSNYYAIV